MITSTGQAPTGRTGLLAIRSAPLLGCLLAAGLTYLFALTGQPTSATGLGESLLLQHDTDISSEIGGNGEKDLPFAEDSDAMASEWSEVKDKFVDLISHKLRVEVVRPQGKLVNMMTTICTKTRVMFLENYEHYFDVLNVGSTSRPMLYAYLGLKFASKEQIDEWYEETRKSRKRNNLIGGCRSFARQRNLLTAQLSQDELDVIKGSKKLIKNQSYLAYLVFSNNLNLYMLDIYLLLCTKLEPETISAEFADLELSFN